jgi:hypothetical protein
VLLSACYVAVQRVLQLVPQAVFARFGGAGPAMRSEPARPLHPRSCLWGALRDRGGLMTRMPLNTQTQWVSNSALNAPRRF